jgi:hypothetical protein
MLFRKFQDLMVQYKHVRRSLNFNKKHRNIFEINKDESKLIESIKNKGYVVIENYYSKADCELVVKEIDRIMLEYPQYLWKDKFDADYRIYGADRISILINKFFNDTFLNRMANLFIEMETVNNHTLAGRITAKNDNIGSGQGWHRDSVSPYQFKSIIYLTDVSMENGPFEYLEGTNKINSL